MFLIPVNDLKFTDVETFCGKFGEGVRVEYKSAMIRDIPKTISAFANTLGGIIIIGVKTDKVKNEVIFPIEGINREEGIEDKIINSALEGIYPAVLPEVKVIDVPNAKNKIVVVIKVHETIEAPHAIQNSTRVYIRTGSRSQPYELADIDRLEYLLKRRQQPEETKRRIISMAEMRCGLYKGPETAPASPRPTLNLIVSTLFPYRPLISLEHLDRFVQDIPIQSPVKYLITDTNRVHQGLCKVISARNWLEYLEINHYGVLFYKGDVHKGRSQWKSGSDKDKISYITFQGLVIPAGKLLRVADLFFTECGYLGNFEVKLVLDNVFGEQLLYDDPQWLGYKSTDKQTCARETCTVESMRQECTTVILSLMKSILWVFNCNVGGVEERVRKILSANHLL